LHLPLSSLKKAAPIKAATSTGLNLLATRETEVANLVALGLPNKEIALKLNIHRAHGEQLSVQHL